MKIKDMPYDRYDIAQGVKKIKALTKAVEKAKSAQEIVDIRKKLLDEEFVDFSTAQALASIRFTLNTSDEFYLKEKDYYDETSAEVSAAMVKFNAAIIDSPFVEEVKKLINPMVIEHASLDSKVINDDVLADIAEDAKIVSEYTKLMASLSFDWKGEQVPLAKIKSLISSANRSERKAATESLGKGLGANGEQLDDIYDRLVKTRHNRAKKLGFSDFCTVGDISIGHYDYGRKEIAEFRRSVLKYAVPIIEKIATSSAKDFGYDRFMFYDNEVALKNGNPDPVLDAQGIFDAGRDMYHKMNPLTGKLFDEMLEREAFDYVARKGKWGGGYAEQINKYKTPFILANFTGTCDDINVITHEFGHAFAMDRAYKNDIDMMIGIGGMETAETHSMSMEMFCDRYADLFYGKRANEAVYAHIMSSLFFLPYGTMVDYFQELVYQNPTLTPKQRNDLWLDLEKQFRPYLSFEGIPCLEQGTRWQYQMHIYEVPFYYIDYVIAQTSALNFMLKSRRDYDEAFNSYLKLVDNGGTLKYSDLVRNAGLPNPFDPEALGGVCKNVAEVLEELKKEF